MYKLSYDLHIHSCLSPCANNEATPRSIALLADLVGLDVVALTDHNSCKNIPAFFNAVKKTSLIPIAGLEVNTAEEIHTLCLFPELEAALQFDKDVVCPALMQIQNREDKNGNQFIMDEEDNITATEPLWLGPATSIPFYAIAEKVKPYGGIIIPAHINRESWGLISVLGDVPDDCGFNCAELRGNADEDELCAKYSYLNQCNIIRNSDAHHLENISLPVNFIEVEEKSAKGVIEALSKTN